MKLIILFYTLFLSISVFGNYNSQKSWECKSPNNKNVISVFLDEGKLTYNVSSDGNEILENSALGLNFKTNPFSELEIVNTFSDNHNEVWVPVIGEREKVHDYYNSLLIDLKEKAVSKRRISIEFRCYNEGIAFRYIIPKQVELDGTIVTEELTEFRFANNFESFPIDKVEGQYSEIPTLINNIDSAYFPLTFNVENGNMASLFEAHVANQPPCKLKFKEINTLHPVFRKGELTIKTPVELTWRGLILASNAGELLQNRIIVENLNPPCAIADVSWIKPGKFLDLNVTEGITMERVIDHFDVANNLGMNTVHIDWSWYGTERKWSKDAIEDFEKYMPDATREVFEGHDWKKNTTGNPMKVAEGYVPYLQFRREFYGMYSYVDVDMEKVVDYGKRNNLGLSLYVNGGVLYPYGEHPVDSVFKTLADWGVSNIKPGFVACESQEDIIWLRNLIESAARNRLTLCIHDAYIADGMRRTYPNLLTQEGGAGRENWPSISHELLLPFTRHLVGAHDHTPTLYSGHEGRTKLYELAQLVVYHGAIQSIRDAYMDREQIGIEKEFLLEVPTVWDDLKVLKAEPGNCILIARKNGKRWFIAGMNDETPRSFDISFDFLNYQTNYELILFEETKDSNDPHKSIKAVNQNDKIHVSLNSKGGFLAILNPKSY